MERRSDDTKMSTPAYAIGGPKENPKLGGGQEQATIREE